MGIRQQVYFKSDRRSRVLILIFCLAPVIVPILAIAAKFLLEDPRLFDVAHWQRVLSSSAQASAPKPPSEQMGRLLKRDDAQSSIFAAPSAAAPDFQWAGGLSVVMQSAPMPPQTVDPADELSLRRAADGL